MAGRGSTTFKKRQKEQTRLEKRQQKAARKLERKALKSGSQDVAEAEGEAGAPGAEADETQLPVPGIE